MKWIQDLDNKTKDEQKKEEKNINSTAKIEKWKRNIISNEKKSWILCYSGVY